MTDPRQRFSSRADIYARYRPGYPSEILKLLQQECGLTPYSVVADIGSGTGILAQMFCAYGNRVYGVEPNQEMRQIAESLLRKYPNFTSVVGTAEATSLPEACADFVTAGQAFHWFERAPTRAEFLRILRPGGWVVLVWNERRLTSTPFMAAYEKLLLTYGIDYTQVRHDRTTPTLGPFFAPGENRYRAFANQQVLDFDGLKGRLVSSSFMPQEGHPCYDGMIAALGGLFAAHQVNGHVTLEYETKVFYGRLG